MLASSGKGIGQKLRYFSEHSSPRKPQDSSGNTLSRNEREQRIKLLYSLIHGRV
jgi:hypothetical protein